MVPKGLWDVSVTQVRPLQHEERAANQECGDPAATVGSGISRFIGHTFMVSAALRECNR